MGATADRISNILAVFAGIFAFKTLTYAPVVDDFIRTNWFVVFLVAMTILAFHNQIGRWVEAKL